MKRTRSAFTLIELLAPMSVLVVLMTVIYQTVGMVSPPWVLCVVRFGRLTSPIPWGTAR